MKKTLLTLLTGAAVVSTAVAVSPDFKSVTRATSRVADNQAISVSKKGDVRFDNASRVKKAKQNAAISETEDLYNVEVLMKEDFSSLNAGNMENPTAVNITESNGDLKGLPGWSGVNVYDAGQALYVDVKFVLNEEEGWGQPEGELWTAPVRNVAGKNMRLKVDVKGVSEDEELYDSMNCIFLAYTDEIPGERRMIDFPYFDITTDFETHEVSCFIPETMTFYNEDDEEVECPVSYIRVKMQPMETPFFITSLELASVEPKVAVPSNLSYSNFSNEGYTARWDAVEGADRYVVEFFTSEFNEDELEFLLTPYETATVEDPSCTIQIPTDMPTFFNVTAYEGEQASPVSEVYMVYSAMPPKMNSAKVADGVVSADWAAEAGATYTEITAYRQVNVGNNGNGYDFLDIDFSGAADEEGDEMMWLDNYAYGWVALPYPMMEDGAVMIDNSGAMWGMPEARIISANSYDLSEITGKVKMTVTAMTPDYCGMVVASGGIDAESGETVTLDADETDLTDEFQDYEFELEARNPEAMFLVQADNSLGTLAVRRIHISVDLPEGAEAGYPYFSGLTEGNKIEFGVPSESYDHIQVKGRTIKQITASMWGMTFTIAEAISRYSDPIIASQETGVGTLSESGNVELFTVDGRRVSSESAAGLYIEKTGGKAVKRIRK